ncbi:putative L-arabonate dehydratase [Streptomyces afghaniensis 772]|uniref:Putative L-arabonate dehydratase n=1 Tax=Streptomyces afghaniensis 772 TaxID=1283301 RepID=S4NQG5_9ACTN|nr:putative L-arabonate dehydratase [Streptomyces afghaniensis 772]
MEVGHGAGEELRVRAAHTGPLDVDDDLTGTGHRRRKLLDLVRAGPGQDERAHHRAAHDGRFARSTVCLCFMTFRNLDRCTVHWKGSMERLRSAQWYEGQDRNAYIHRAWMRRGVPGDAFTGRPQIAIANTASDLTPCNAHLNEVAASVRNGVYEAGGIPLDLPVVSLGETQVRPTAMLWRNMAAMATEEMLRANPVDGVVLLGGCDKTIPSLLMAAASVDLPAVVVPGGPMLNGTFRGGLLGCGTGVWQLSEEVRAGTLSQEEFTRSESAMIRSRGHCNTMGTASTMALVAEALGTVVPGTAGTPPPTAGCWRPRTTPGGSRWTWWVPAGGPRRS